MTGTYIVHLGHSRVYGCVDTGARARYRSCLCRYSMFDGKHGLCVQCRRAHGQLCIVCRWERIDVIVC